MCVYLSMDTCEFMHPKSSEKGGRYTEAGITGSYKPPNINAENQKQVLWYQQAKKD